MDHLESAAAILRNARSVVVLTGAGISAESGVATFRDAGGLWEGHRVHDVATPTAFRRNPRFVWKFYNQRRAQLTQVAPNPGHFALVAMEQRWKPSFAIVTQNVDHLHRLAGNERIHELHGNLHRVRCTRCETITDRGLEPLGEMPPCPECGHLLRPDIVWFDEILPEDVWTDALEAVHGCDCLIVVGTSAVVYPAAGLIPLARNKTPSAKVIEVNLNAALDSDAVDVALQGPSGVLLPQLVAMLDD